MYLWYPPSIGLNEMEDKWKRKEKTWYEHVLPDVLPDPRPSSLMGNIYRLTIRMNDDGFSPSSPILSDWVAEKERRIRVDGANLYTVNALNRTGKPCCGTEMFSIWKKLAITQHL